MLLGNKKKSKFIETKIKKNKLISKKIKTNINLLEPKPKAYKPLF